VLAVRVDHAVAVEDDKLHMASRPGAGFT